MGVERDREGIGDRQRDEQIFRLRRDATGVRTSEDSGETN
jgi:hypothetical protein